MELNIIINFIQNRNITHLVVHGLKWKTQHTHRYIHESIYNTFLYIADRCAEQSITRPTVIWCDDKADSTKIYTNICDINNPESNYLIFTTPHLETDKYLPILQNAYYIVHFRKEVLYKNTPITKYDYLLQTKRAVKYVEFRYDPTNTYYHENNMTGVITIDNTPFWFDTIANEAHLAWGTNLLPKEINTNIELIRSSNDPLFKLQSYFCGSIWRVNESDIIQWDTNCKRIGIDSICEKQMDESMHQQMVRESFLSHAIQGESQRQSDIKYYIPCRILKNISYGAIPITNNIGVYNMLKEYGVIYDIDIARLFDKALVRYNEILENYDDYKREQIRVMEYIRDHHTFLNRISTIIKYGFLGYFSNQLSEALQQLYEALRQERDVMQQEREVMQQEREVMQQEREVANIVKRMSTEFNPKTFGLLLSPTFSSEPVGEIVEQPSETIFSSPNSCDIASHV